MTPQTPKISIQLLRKPYSQTVLARLDEINKQGNDPSFKFSHAQNIFVALKQNEIIGFAVLNKPHGYWYFRNCVVDKKHRGGIQQKLIDARITHVKTQGGDKVSVGVFPKNYRSLNNLITRGFKFKGMVNSPKIGEYQLLVKYL